jgi:hypothetical protein
MECRFYPVTHQQRKLYLQYLAYGPYVFNITFDFQFYRPDRIWIEQALDILWQRHEILRTTYDYDEGGVYQKIHSNAFHTADIRHINLIAREDRDVELACIRNELSGVKFDLTNGPIAQLRIVEYSEELGGILFCIHHIAADQHSALLINNELEAIVAGLKTGETSELPLPKNQVRHYVEWTEKFIESLEGRNQVERYRKRVWDSIDKETRLNIPDKDSYVAELSSDLKRKFGEEKPVWHDQLFGNIIRWNCVSSATYTFFIDEPAFPELVKLRSMFPGGFSIVVLAAFVVLFSVLRKTKFIRLCIPSSILRTSEDWRDTIGWLTGEIILCHELDYDKTFPELMDGLLENVIGCAKDQLYYLEKLLYNLDFPVNITAPALINIIPRDGEEGSSFEPVHRRTDNATFEFESAIVILDNGIFVSTKYDLSVYSAKEIDNFFGMYVSLLGRCAECGEKRPIHELLDKI